MLNKIYFLFLGPLYDISLFLVPEIYENTCTCICWQMKPKQQLMIE